MRRLGRAVGLLCIPGFVACSAGAGLYVLSAPNEKIRVERSAHVLLERLPFTFVGRRFTFHIVGDDRASEWNIAPGIIYISQPAARNAPDDELTQLIAHSIGHDLLAHPVNQTDISDSRQAAELAAIAVVPGGLLLAGIMEGMLGSSDHTLAQEIDADRIGLRLWLHGGRTCAAWMGLREKQKEQGRSWHEPRQDVTPPFDDLMAMARGECGGRP